MERNNPIIQAKSRLLPDSEIKYLIQLVDNDKLQSYDTRNYTIEDIVFIKSLHTLSKISLNNGMSIGLPSQLNMIENMLEQCNFVRTHDLYLINMAYFNRFGCKGNETSIQLSTGDCIPVALDRKEKVRNQLETLLQIL